MSANIKAEVPLTRAELAGYVLALAALVFGVLVYFRQMQPLPESITLFGDDSPKNFLLLFPFVGVISSFFMLIIARLPHIITYSFKVTENNAARVYAVSRGGFTLLAAVNMCFFMLLFRGLLRAAQGGENYFLPICLGCALLCMLCFIVMTIRWKKAAVEEA